MSLPVAKCARSLFGTRGDLVMWWVQIASPLGVQTFCPTHMTNMTFSSKPSLVLLTGISGDYLTNMSYLICFIISLLLLLFNNLFIFHSTPSDTRPATDSFLDYEYFHWSNHPFIRGGYTSPTAHVYNLRHVLARPVEDRLFFAGEATSLRSCSTVPTAIETGICVADQVCLAAKKGSCSKL